MKLEILKVFLFDGLGKLVMAASSLLLIKYLSISEYSEFIAIFTLVVLIYQGVCGVIERLYIVEHKQYVSHQVNVKNILMLAGIALGGGYVFLYQGAVAGWFFVLLVVLSVNYQVERIRLQRVEKYTKFILAELSRNFLWFVLIIFLIFLYGGAGFSHFVLLGYGLSTVIIFIALKNLYSSNLGELDSTLEREPLYSTLTYLIEKKNILSYCLIAALFPYLAFLVSGFLEDERLIATYGAALRYQAIFSMAVYAANAVLISKMANNVGYEKEILADFKRLLPWLLLVAILASYAVWWFIPVVDGGKYPEVRGSFLLLVFCSLCSLIATPFVNILLANKCYRDMLISMLIGGFVFLMLSAPFYLYSKYYGILSALAISYFFILLSNVFFAKRQINNEAINS